MPCKGGLPCSCSLWLLCTHLQVAQLEWCRPMCTCILQAGQGACGEPMLLAGWMSERIHASGCRRSSSACSAHPLCWNPVVPCTDAACRTPVANCARGCRHSGPKEVLHVTDGWSKKPTIFATHCYPCLCWCAHAMLSDSLALAAF